MGVIKVMETKAGTNSSLESQSVAFYRFLWPESSVNTIDDEQRYMTSII